MLSEKLVEHYVVNTDTRVYDALIFSHSTFDKDYCFVNDPEPHNWYSDQAGGVKTTFEPVPFQIQLPQVGEGQQDLDITLPNIGIELISKIERAAMSREPINVRYLAFIDGDDFPQTDIDYLEIKKVSWDDKVVTAQASRRDLYKRYLLGDNRYDYRWEGLYL